MRRVTLEDLADHAAALYKQSIMESEDEHVCDKLMQLCGLEVQESGQEGVFLIHAEESLDSP